MLGQLVAILLVTYYVSLPLVLLVELLSKIIKKDRSRNRHFTIYSITHFTSYIVLFVIFSLLLYYSLLMSDMPNTGAQWYILKYFCTLSITSSTLFAIPIYLYTKK